MSITLTPKELTLLRDILQLNTVTPMETGCSSSLIEAQTLYTKAAQALGFRIAHFAKPSNQIATRQDTPLSVKEKFLTMGEEFFDCQPNLVLHYGKTFDTRNTLLFNFHMDTVSGDVDVSIDAERITGRGIVDAKGLGVAILAAVRLASELDPSLKDNVSIIIQSVTGEEGGAMGVYGTRYLTELGWIGKLNIVCEPTNFALFDHTTTSMTALFCMNGRGVTDDEPCNGHNATIILASLADHLTQVLANRIHAEQAKMCVAGIHTGHLHNRVYGNGTLHVNFSYENLMVAQKIEEWVEHAFAQWCGEFTKKYQNIVTASLSARDLREIASLIWTKRQLPVLHNRDAVLEKMFEQINIFRHESNSPHQTFTCDAMWLQAQDSYTVVYGPGDLGVNHAHAAGEFITLNDFNQYIENIANIILAFAAHQKHDTTSTTKDIERHVYTN